ncbi:MAG TPA: HNH endonuclease [Bacillus bacterium]|nr:HNH endonuclease [Bacillus sp. (in: firmicutes)]
MIREKLKFRKECINCNKNRLISQFTSSRSRICNICKITSRNTTFIYKGVTYNRRTKRLKGVITLETKDGKKRKIKISDAKLYVKQGRAIIKDKSTISEQFNEEELRDLVLARADYRCQFCGQESHNIEMIKSSRDGGKRTPLNLHCICEKCEQIINPSKNDESIIIGIRKSRARPSWDNRILKIFCDCSMYSQEKIGVGLVFIKNQSIRTISEVFSVEVAVNSVYGELLAIVYALNHLVDTKNRSEYIHLRSITIYSDVNHIQHLLYTDSQVNPIYNSVIRKIKELTLLVTVIYPKTALSIQYLGDKENRRDIVFYNLAHDMSRKWINQKKRKVISVLNIL